MTEARPAARPSVVRRLLRIARELALVVGVAVVLSLILKTFFFQSFWIPSSSMEQTLLQGDRILVTKWKPGPLDMRRGDIVVFKDPGGWLEGAPEISKTELPGPVEDVLTFVGLLPEDAGQHLVKRVIGMPGDQVECCDAQGRITVNGVALDEPYLPSGTAPSNDPFSTVVPEAHVWVLGDNRGASRDSRFHTGNPGGGSVPIDNIVGVAFATVWPLDHWNGLGNPFPVELHRQLDEARDSS